MRMLEQTQTIPHSNSNQRGAQSRECKLEVGAESREFEVGAESRECKLEVGAES